MKIEVLAIGSEILSGSILNTNAKYLTELLNSLGFSVFRHTVLPDEKTGLKEGLKEAKERSDLVICTGGLGPTFDDMTRDIATELFNSDTRYDESWAENLKNRFGNRITSVVNQATVPTKATLFENTQGTALGLAFLENQKGMVFLPGVPGEMKEMAEHQLTPWLKEKYLNLSAKFVKTLYFWNVIEAQMDPVLREYTDPDIEMGIYPGLGLLRVQLKSSDEKKLNPIIERLNQEFGSWGYETTIGQIAEAVYNAFISSGKTLAVAESCTGGKVASTLTSIPGASRYFLGGMVVYSNFLKERLLGVSPETLEEFGAVSKETVQEMVLGTQKVTNCDWALAISGVAGPGGGTKEKPVGTVYVGIGKKGEDVEVFKLKKSPGNRDKIIQRTVNLVLGELLIRV